MAESNWPKKPKVRKVVVMPEAVKEVLRAAPPGVDSGELLNELLRAWGGAAQLAKDLKSEFTSAVAGGMTRQRILEMIQRLIVVNTQHDLANVVRPTDMTQAELEAAARHYYLKIAANEPEEEEEVGFT